MPKPVSQTAKALACTNSLYLPERLEKVFIEHPASSAFCLLQHNKSSVALTPKLLYNCVSRVKQ